VDTPVVPPRDDKNDAPPERRMASGWVISAAGGALIVGVLYVGRDVLIPLAIAILLSFLLSPIVTAMGRVRIPRVAAVVLTVLVAFALIGGFGLLVGTQATQLASELPTYQNNIAEKLRGLREASPRGGVVEGLTGMFEALRDEVESDEDEEPPEYPIVEVRQPPRSAFDVLRDVASPLLGPIGKLGLVIVLVIFILLEREDLRNRLIRLIGPNMHVTTEVLDEAGYRVSRYLLMQLVVNVTYGIPLGIGLYFIGIPNAALWAVLAIMLRFIPYLGPVLSAFFPLMLAIAVDPGWTTLLMALGLILVLELVSNNFIEPWLYGASTSISAVAIIISAIFWTTLWGPIGLLLATPLTVCFAVAGRYFPGLRFLDIMLGSAPALALHERFYQRLLAGDADENVRIAEKYLDEHSLVELYDDIALPALKLAAADNARGSLSSERRLIVARTALEVVNELVEHDEKITPADEAFEAAALAEVEAAGERPVGPACEPPDGQRRSVLCAAGRSGLDLAVAAMLAQLLERRGFATRIVSAEALSPEHLPSCRVHEFDAVCLSFIGATAALRVQQTCRRIARRAPRKPLLVGLWADSDAERGPPLHLPSEAMRVATLHETLARIDALIGKGFESPAIPSDEQERLSDIEALHALDARSSKLDAITRRLAAAFGVPIALLNVVDADDQHWRAQTGLPEELASAGKSPRETSICGHVVAEKELIVVEDALNDPRFAKNPFLLEHGIRFYAGAPLQSKRGHAVGSLCVVDASPHKVTEEQRTLLLGAAAEAMAELEALSGAGSAAAGGKATSLPEAV
jgi:predicted PurR-regulated permease PerM